MTINTKESMIIVQTFLNELEKMEEKDVGTTLSIAALNNALAALQKQIKMDVKKCDGMFVVCPSCKKTVLPSEHCSKCGQALAEK